MYSFEAIDLGAYRGDNYFLAGFVEPEPTEGENYDPDEDATEYGVTLVRSVSNPLEENVQIVRIDTAHGRPHMDLLYLPVDVDGRKVWLDDDYEYSRMKRYLLANWRRFVDLYIQYNE